MFEGQSCRGGLDDLLQERARPIGRVRDCEGGTRLVGITSSGASNASRAGQAAMAETWANAALTARSAASGPKATPSIVITSISVTPSNERVARR